ncbi:hypothetical protein ACVBEJ_00005, partial [Porticoccus sp. GXU_MW_L64]
RSCCRVDYSAFERLEPYAGKLARTVLRGAGSSNTVGLPDHSTTESTLCYCSLNSKTAGHNLQKSVLPDCVQCSSKNASQQYHPYGRKNSRRVLFSLSTMNRRITMEYLDMHGTVALKKDADMSVVRHLVGKLREIEFSGSGFVDLRIGCQQISISAEGAIADSHCLRKALRQLQNQLHEDSTIEVDSALWETNVSFKHLVKVPVDKLDTPSAKKWNLPAAQQTLSGLVGNAVKRLKQAELNGKLKANTQKLVTAMTTALNISFIKRWAIYSEDDNSFFSKKGKWSPDLQKALFFKAEIDAIIHYVEEFGCHPDDDEIVKVRLLIS